jgi:hypothetical protein
MRLFTTVLAGESVAREDIAAAVPDVPFRDAVEPGQQDDTRNRNLPARRSDPIFAWLDAAAAPLFEIEGLVLEVDDKRDIHVDQRKGAAHRCHVNRQVGTIEYENARIQHVYRPPC